MGKGKQSADEMGKTDQDGTLSAGTKRAPDASQEGENVCETTWQERKRLKEEKRARKKEKQAKREANAEERKAKKERKKLAKLNEISSSATIIDSKEQLNTTENDKNDKKDKKDKKGKANKSKSSREQPEVDADLGGIGSILKDSQDTAEKQRWQRMQDRLSDVRNKAKLGERLTTTPHALPGESSDQAGSDGSDNLAESRPKSLDQIASLLDRRGGGAEFGVSVETALSGQVANVSGADEISRKETNSSSTGTNQVSQQAALATDRVVKMQEGNKPLDISSLGLFSSLTTNLSTLGVTKLFPVQSYVLANVLCKSKVRTSQPSWWGTSRDVCVCAPTGSGKTLAYGIPVVQTLLHRSTVKLRVLIMLPSRELASQVHEVLERLSAGSSISFGLCVSGALPPRAPVDGLVATPGTFVEWLSQGVVQASDLEFLVVDEADRLLTQSYQEWVPLLLSACSTVRGVGAAASGSVPNVQEPASSRPAFTPGRMSQFGPPRLKKLLFSATLKSDSKAWSALGLKNQLFVTAGTDGKFKTPDELKEYMAICEGQNKPLVLSHILSKLPKKQVIIFVASVEDAHKLCRLLQLQGLYSTQEFSSLLNSSERVLAFERLKSGETQILVTSDASARGIDIPEVAAVINYDPPSRTDTYVHRAGRTARAGREGTVYTVVLKQQLKKFKNILRFADNRFVRKWISGPEDLEAAQASLNDALKELHPLLVAEQRQRISPMADMQTIRRMTVLAKHEGDADVIAATSADDCTEGSKPELLASAVSSHLASRIEALVRSSWRSKLAVH